MKNYNVITKDEKGKKVIESIPLEDKDFLLITAIDNLTNAIKNVGVKLWQM